MCGPWRWISRSLREEEGMAKKRIAVVDDDPDILLTLQLALEKHGHEVVVAETVGELLESALTRPPDLVILDVMLPDVWAYDVCYDLKARFNNCPVIMISARSQRPDIERGFWSGADDYFTKPLELDALLTRIAELTEPGGKSSEGADRHTGG